MEKKVELIMPCDAHVGERELKVLEKSETLQI